MPVRLEEPVQPVEPALGGILHLQHIQLRNKVKSASLIKKQSHKMSTKLLKEFNINYYI